MNDEAMLPEQQIAFNKYVKGDNLFLTGSGGVGKSYVIKQIIKYATQKFDLEETDGSKKYMAKTAMIGCAACLVGGSTLHSWACIGLGVKPVKDLVKKIQMKPAFAMRWRNCRLFILDEVSMMSVELFEKLDKIARILRKRPNDFFGGIQVIFSGDFAQLPPIDKGKVVFAFESAIWKRYLDPHTIYLTRIVRQTDPVFQKILTEVRMGIVSPESRSILRSKVINGEQLKKLLKKKDAIQPTVLYSYVAQVDQLNKTKLNHLINKSVENYSYRPEYSYTLHTYLDYLTKKNIKSQMDKLFDTYKKKGADDELLEYPPLKGNRGNVIVDLAVGSQVLLTHNLDVNSGLANGTRGIVVGFATSSVVGGEKRPIVLFDNGYRMTMERENSPTEQLGVDINVSQYPLTLAWATSIHKAIGATITFVIIDLSNCFECGQAYVALSRCRSLDGLYLIGINFSAITCNVRVRDYYRRFSYKCVWNLTKDCKENGWKEYSRIGLLGQVESCSDCLPKILFKIVKNKKIAEKVAYFLEN